MFKQWDLSSIAGWKELNHSDVWRLCLMRETQNQAEACRVFCCSIRLPADIIWNVQMSWGCGYSNWLSIDMDPLFQQTAFWWHIFFKIVKICRKLSSCQQSLPINCQNQKLMSVSWTTECVMDCNLEMMYFQVFTRTDYKTVTYV